MSLLFEQFDTNLLPANTLHSIMVLCGLNDNDQPNPNPDGIGSTAARIADDIFMNNFEKCLLMSPEELESDLTFLSKLPVNAIYCTSSVRTKLKAFVAWTKCCFHFGVHPEETTFPVGESLEIVTQAARLVNFSKASKLMAQTASPGPFKTSMDWASWSNIFTNFLHQIPSTHGYPLSYVLCNDEDRFIDPQAGFDLLEISKNALPLDGCSFAIDSLQVHTYIQTFIAGNAKAESAVGRHHQNPCGRADWIALRAVYEGTGAFKLELQEAERVLDTMFYHSEKPNGLNWSTFAMKLTNAFNDVNNSCAPGTVAYDDIRKIKHVLKKTSSVPVLQGYITQITRDLADPGCTLTFEQVLAQMQNAVTLAPKKDNRVIQSTNSGRGGQGGRGGGRGRGNSTQVQRGGNGRGGRGGKGNTIGNRSRNHPDAYILTLMNGKVISAHPSYLFTTQEMAQMHPTNKQTIFNKRKEYRESRQVSQTGTQGTQAAGTQSGGLQLPVGWIPNPNGNDAQSVISQVTQQIGMALSQVGATMGGRNEEANKRGNRNLSPVYSIHKVARDSRYLSAVRHNTPKENVYASNSAIRTQTRVVRGQILSS